MNLVTVREHARLTIGSARPDDLDCAAIPASAFDWLCREAQRHRAGGAALVQVEDRRWLRLDNYVGVLESPCGTRIEILPKHVRGKTDKSSARRVLVRMLRHGLHLPVRDAGPTALSTFDAPVSEWIIRQFLQELDVIVRRGVRFDYRQVDDELGFLRGRLHMTRQLRQPVGRQHLFQVEHNVFDANRPENRLLASALHKVGRMTRDVGNWRLAHELEHQISVVPRSHDEAGDFRRWSQDSLMKPYARIRPWCELILGDRNPMSVLGEWTGRSLLFPMEKVFECYVEACLRSRLPATAKLRRQAAGRYLCSQGERSVFHLRPDFVIEHSDGNWVVDAKWKLIDGADEANNYGLNHGDFYQLFAYGQRYLGGRGRMVLVFPASDSFPRALDTFDLHGGLWLDVVPLDLGSGTFPAEPAAGIPAAGDWFATFPESPYVRIGA